MATPEHGMNMRIVRDVVTVVLLSSRRSRAAQRGKKTVGTDRLVRAGPFVFAPLKSAFFFKPVVCVELLSDGFQRISARNREGDAVGAGGGGGGGQYRGEVGWGREEQGMTITFFPHLPCRASR